MRNDSAMMREATAYLRLVTHWRDVGMIDAHIARRLGGVVATWLAVRLADRGRLTALPVLALGLHALMAD